MPRKRKTAYMISVVARQFEVHPQTLRLYEREGLLRPSRTQGNTRLYSDEDLETLQFILNLTREMGVNLAGVEIIMNMRRRMEAMQQDMEHFLDSLRDALRQRRQGDVDASRALVRIQGPGRIIKVQKG
jgi:MerR family transcriptional regulator/heat shock protein HspR